MRMYLLDKKQRVRRWLKDNDFIEAEMTEEINAANQINFSMPLKDRIADNIYYVAIPTPRSKQKYLLFKLLSERVQNDRIEYQGIEEAYDELKQYGYIKDIRPNDRTAEEMLKMVLEPTRWTLGNVPETNHQSTNFYYITYLEALQKIVGLFNIELTFEVTIDPKSNKITRRQVNVYNQQGQRTGKRFEYGSNLLTIEQEQDSQELITALVGRGKGEQVSEGHDDTPDGYGRRITFADVVWTKKDGNPVDKPAGQEYLVDPEATELYGFSDGNPRIGLTVFEDIEDPIELINATWKALQSLKRPKVSFKASVTDVGKLGLGDTVAIIRHDLKIEYFTRVYKVKHDLLNENNNQIELGDDFSSHSITNSIIKVDGIANEAKEVAGHAAIAANGKNNNYYSSVQPLAPIEGDIWYKDLGNGEVDMYQYHNGGWVFIQSTRDLHIVQNQVKEAQSGLTEGKQQIEVNKKLADQDIEKLNQSIIDNKNIADQSLHKLDDSVAKLQSQYDNNIVPDLTKVTNDVADALQKYISAQNNIADLTKQAQDQGKNIADITKTVDGLNINYANLLGDVNTTKIDVKGLQTTLGTANGDIAQLKLDAQNLQTMLAGKVDNTTYTNFVNLTNQALNARLTASDLNGYAKTADVQATANGLRVDLNSVTDRMNNLKVGGRNLIPNSGTDIVIESKTTDPYPAWDNKAVYWNLTPGETYTFSVSATNTNGVEQASVRIFKSILDGKYINKEAAHWYFNADGKRHSFTFTTPNDAIPYDIWLYAGPMGTLQGKDFTTTYHHPQLEVGTVATDYRPAPEDVANDITQLSARITANSQQFSSYYTKSETNTKTNIAKNDAVNAIKSDSNWTGLKNVLTNSGFLQTADGFLQKVQQTTVPMFNGGGVNLLLNTQNFDHNWAWDNIDHSYAKGVLTLSDTNNGNSRMYQGLADNPAGKTFSLSFNAKISADCDSENVSIKAGPYDAPKWITVTGKNSQSYKIEGWKWTSTSINFSLYVIGGKIDISNLKLEYGSVATPYSPNPADLATQSAFSELSQSLEGLRSTVGSNYGSLQSQISQSSSSIRTELTDKIKGIDNKTTSTADSLNSVIGRVGSLENLTNFQVINNAINANDYTNTGNYFIKSTANTNVPGINWCYLKVERVSDGRIVQTWQADSDPTLRYVRTKFSDSWTQWQRSASYSEYSELNRTVQGLQSTVSNNHGELQSQISQTAKTIRQEVSDKTSGLQTQITQQANNFNVSLNSLRKETAWQKVTSAIDANNYKTTGNYWIQAAPNSNTPDSSAWAYLQVVAYPDVKRIKQTWQRDNNENEIYTRLLIGDNWTSWQRTVTGGNIMAQINMSAGATLIQNDKIYMDASSTVFSGNAFIPSAAITSLNADKITTGTLNAANVNIINLNANNITTGTINGQNLKINLNTGEILFQHGKITSTLGTLNINVDTGIMSVTDMNGAGVYYSNGEMFLNDGPINGWFNNPAFGGIRRSPFGWKNGSTGIQMYSKNGVSLETSNYNGGFANGSIIDSTSTGAAVEVDSSGSTTINGANVTSVVGGSQFETGSMGFKNRAHIWVGSNITGESGNRIVMDGDFVHIISAYRHTTGDAPNLFVANDGALVRSTSASKYKTNIKRSHSTDYGERLLNLPVATWIDKGQKERYEAGKRHIKPNKYFGMIAEDLADAGLDLLVSRNVDGEIEGIQYERIAPALIPVIKKLKDKVEKLEEKLNEQSK